MEGPLPDIESPSLQKPLVVRLLDKLELAANQAKDLRDRTEVSDPDLQKALSIVGEFLRKKKRVCYGGMAINAHLTKKFYDFTKVLPDYDFFSPDGDGDTNELLSLLNKAGFEEPKARLGIHEGTTKIYVNYVAIADITQIPAWRFRLLQESAIQEDGIYYADADFLRANMYLELSRPRGEIERWDKVYKRLLLLNMEVPPKPCSKKGHDHKLEKIPKSLFLDLLNYAANQNFIYCGANLKDVYEHPSKPASEFVIEKGACPLIAFTKGPLFHCRNLLRSIREDYPAFYSKIKVWKSADESVPLMAGIQMKNGLAVLLLDQNFCNSYFNVKLSNDSILKIASLDTLITLYYSLEYVKQIDGIVPHSPKCFANTLVRISIKTRDAGDSGNFPAFGIYCSGHQPTKASLLEAKARRIKSLKRKIGKVGKHKIGKKNITRKLKKRNKK